MFHDSNSADPTGPIVKPTDPSENGGGGSGQPAPAPETDPVVTNLRLLDGTPKMGYEGQKPPIADFKIEVWWSNGKITEVNGNDATIVTIPRVLWESSTNTASGSSPEIAAYTPITVYHINSVPGANFNITLPGVAAISGAELTVSAGSVASFYEDDAAPDLSAVKVKATYKNLSGNGITPYTGKEEEFSLDYNYIFTDYWHGFPDAITGTNSTTNLPNDKRYAYGVDTTEKNGATSKGTVYALISRPADDSKHYTASSETKYAKVDLTKLYYVNHIIMEREDYALKSHDGDNKDKGYWFSDDTHFLGNNSLLSPTGVITPGTNNGRDTNGDGGREYWKKVIENSDVNFKVHYMEEVDTTTKDRDVDFLKRAFLLKDAQVEIVPDFRLYEDNPDAVTLRVGYYGYDNLGGWNTPDGEYFPNYMTFIIEIARFTEAIRFERETVSVAPIPLDSRAETGTYISEKLLKSIKDTYKLEGIYEYKGDTIYREIKDESLWDTTWFVSGDLRNFSEDVAQLVDIEVTIKTSPELLAAGLRSYVGLEDSFQILAIPAR